MVIVNIFFMINIIIFIFSSYHLVIIIFMIIIKIYIFPFSTHHHCHHHLYPPLLPLIIIQEPILWQDVNMCNSINIMIINITPIIIIIPQWINQSSMFKNPSCNKMLPCGFTSEYLSNILNVVLKSVLCKNQPCEMSPLSQLWLLSWWKTKLTLFLDGIVIPDAVKTSSILLPSIVFFASSSSRLDHIQNKISSTVEYFSVKEKFKIFVDRSTTFRGGMMLDVVCVSDKKCPYVSLRPNYSWMSNNLWHHGVIHMLYDDECYE